MRKERERTSACESDCWDEIRTTNVRERGHMRESKLCFSLGESACMCLFKGEKKEVEERERNRKRKRETLAGCA